MTQTGVLQIDILGKVTAEIVAGTAVTFTSGLVAYYARKIHQDWEGRGERVDELYSAMFGMDNVSTIEGVIEIVESHDTELEGHDNRLENLEDRMEEGEKKRKEIRSRIERLKQNCSERTEEA